MLLKTFFFFIGQEKNDIKKNNVQLSWNHTLISGQLLIYIIYFFKKKENYIKTVGKWNLTQLTTLTGKIKTIKIKRKIKKIHKLDPTLKFLTIKCGSKVGEWNDRQHESDHIPSTLWNNDNKHWRLFRVWTIPYQSSRWRDNLIIVYELTVNTDKFKNQKPLQQNQQLYQPFRVQTKQEISSLKSIPSFETGHWISPPTRLQLHQSTTHRDKPRQ